ncbi:hypothetical protein ONS95_005880 [Cadophora gregata]|uniref:uncharacterized protein n=1 Tax=Cadophora gregata TaxID=51156 RepID=UPI0026DA9E71|nr:uncharacterized protein ONS95_005880 [Cadophora gregata]KAK0102258.1 hypothetical protein ONS95_005880 [Cadophora gregata]KAK0103885.1 hypothetical protein ONS96_004993 [Cadophora gregata f. sp. sojae]
MRSSLILSATAGAPSIAAQNNASTANGCNDGFFPGTDTVIYTTPYTYSQVMSIIGSYQNLTWSGSPEGSVTLNGTDNTVGTARTYDIAGAHVVETITVYSKPPNGPYEEIHTLDLVTLPSANVSFYGDYDGTTVTPTCDGKASIINFTINFCATNTTVAAAALHEIHLTDAQTVGNFLGGQNFTTCEAIVSSNSTATTTSTPPVVTGNAASGVLVSVSSLAFAVGLLTLVGM